MIYYVEDDTNIRDLTVYALRQAGFEAQAQLANAVRDIEHMKPEDILKSTIPLHKGAIRYYRERGIQIPDRLIFRSFPRTAGSCKEGVPT